MSPPHLCIFNLRVEKHLVAGTNYHNQAASISPASIELCVAIACAIASVPIIVQVRMKMVHIVTGKINEGKTLKMQSIYDKNNTGDGFITQKVIKDGVLAGYELVRLSNLSRRPLIMVAGNTQYESREFFRYGRFNFSKAAFDHAERIIDGFIATGTNPIYIDEIGPVELMGMGFFMSMQKVLDNNKELYIAARESCIESVLSKFGIIQYELIHVYDNSCNEQGI